MRIEAVLETPAVPARILDRAAVPPLAIILAIVGLTFMLEQWIPLRWAIPAYRLIWPAGACFGMAIFYSSVRVRPAFQEIGLYLGLWIFFPIFAAKLSYIATCAGLPLRDRFFIAADAAIGFNWSDWVHFVKRYPAIVTMQDYAYGSSFWQPLLTVIVLALWGPRGRNGEFLTSILLALLSTILTYIFVPTLGPADMFGQHAQQAELIESLRSGSLGPYPYFGVISFPSFHTAMALLYITAHRGNRFTFLPALALNLAMLTAVPYQGDHYLSDMIAGAGIALMSFLAARFLYRRLEVSRDDARAT